MIYVCVFAKKMEIVPSLKWEGGGGGGRGQSHL